MFITIQNFIFAFSVNLQKQKGFQSTATFQIIFDPGWSSDYLKEI